jgi:rhomboid family GlyGly-CTERM serine protease
MSHRRGSLTWPACSAGLAAIAVLSYSSARTTLDFQPALADVEPWRLWSAAFVHWSSAHLIANLAGCAVVGAFGWAAHAGRREVLAWLLSWPLTHAALALEPSLAHYGGLSGLLHAGVAVAAVGLLGQPSAFRRRVGWIVLGGLALKVLLELRLGPAPLGGGASVAPFAHAAGALAGAGCAWLLARVAARGDRPRAA